MNTLLRFGISGGVATATHVGVFVALVELTGVPAVVASIPAFCLALLASYSLNYHWTFGASGKHRVMMPRFAVVAIAGLGVNALITYAVVDLGGYWYGYALMAVIMIVPLLTFLISRHWVFETRG